MAIQTAASQSVTPKSKKAAFVTKPATGEWSTLIMAASQSQAANTGMLMQPATSRMQASLLPAAAATMLLLEHWLVPLALCQSINTLMQKCGLHESRSCSRLLSLAVLVSAFLSTETGTMLPGQAFNSTCQVGI